MIKHAFFCYFLLISFSAVSQQEIKLYISDKEAKKYKEEAVATRREIWGWNKPEFAVRTIPAEFANASQIVIARHMEIEAGKKRKSSVGLFDATSKELYLTETVRQTIKINDKAAVTDYSEIDFRELIKSNGYNFGVSANLFAGVRVIKPDGTIKDVEVDDIILAKEDLKLAVADLQTGDIIDYFLVKRRVKNEDVTGEISSYAFKIIDASPIMFYSIHIETGKNYAVEYRYYNGAPDFKRKTTEEGENVFDMLVKNVPANAESSLWISPYRQLPMIRMNIKMGNKGTVAAKYNLREPGKVYPNPPADQLIEDEKTDISYFKNYEMRTGGETRGIASSLVGKISKYYFQILKEMDKLPFDSAVAELYYLYRYARLLNVANYSGIETVINAAQAPVNPNRQLYDFASLLRSKDTECELALVTAHSGPDMKEIFRTDDINWMLLAKGGKDKLFGWSDMFSPAFHIPYEYEDTKKALAIGIVGRRKDYQGTTIDIPGSSSSQNARIETIGAAIAADGTGLQLNRRTVLKGHYKPEVQKKLVLFEDYCAAERNLFGETKPLLEELANTRKSYAAELKVAFDKERSKQKESFVDEAKDWFDQTVADVSDYKVENLGVRHNNSDFVYSSKFNMGGLVKKAGNNMIVDIGKLQGSPLTISASQRKRKYDIYMPFARSLQVQISFQIPDGYTAEGVKELNRKVENETGYFIAEATSDGKSITVNIKKSYNHAYEPVGNWEKLLAFMDAANEWSNAKILLKKK